MIPRVFKCPLLVEAVIGCSSNQPLIVRLVTDYRQEDVLYASVFQLAPPNDCKYPYADSLNNTTMIRLHTIIAELHRRRVLHMMAYYIVSAWVVLQVADLAFESWGVPDEVMRYVWITAVMGFPIALLFSWKYDITIHGIVRTPPIVASQGADLSLRRGDHLVLIALVVVASALAYGLTREIVTSIAEPLRIAVLPLKNLSRSEDDSYIALGTTEELTSRLSKLGGLRVIANRSVLRFAESNLSAAQIGQELGVDVLLEGSVRKLGERVRIGLRLIDTDSEEQQWTREYDGFLDNLLAVQINIADQVASALNVQIESDERRRLVKRSTDNAEAYRLYLKGRYFWSKLIRDEVEKAARLFQQAINLDPTYGQAWAGLADTYNFLGELGALPPDEAFSKARSAAEHALEIDDELAEAHTSLGQILTNYYWDWQAAGSHFEQAIVLDPNYLPARHFYSEYLRDLVKPSVYWALASPCSAASRYHFAASAWSWGTPRPWAYMKPSSSWAKAMSCSAASRYHFTASTWSWATPWPLAYMTPRLYWASASPCWASGRHSFKAVA